MTNVVKRKAKYIRFDDIWIVSNSIFHDLKYNFYLAIRGKDGRTYRGPGYNNIDNLDFALLKASNSRRVKAAAFKETDQYGIDFL